jgi:hypothetical protein
VDSLLRVTTELRTRRRLEGYTVDQARVWDVCLIGGFDIIGVEPCCFITRGSRVGISGVEPAGVLP